MNYVDALDISNYTAPLLPAQIEYIRTHVHTVVIGLQDSTKARAFKAQLTGVCHLQYYVDKLGRDLSIPDSGSRVWVDIEVGCFIRRADVLLEVSVLLNAGLDPGIYGNESSITPVMGVSTELSRLPLWWANYNGVPADFSGFIPFNGWTECEMWQYSSNGVAGINCDLNLLGLENDIMERSADGHFIHLLDPSGFVVYRWGSTDGSSGSRQSRPRNGDVNSPDHWEWLRTQKTSKHAYWSKVEGD